MGAHMERRTLLKSLAAAPLLSAPVLAGCANRGSDTPEGTLNIGQISDSVAFFPLFIAEENGYFKDEGITVGERPRLGTGAKVAAALKSGSIDLGAGVITDAFNLAQSEPGTRLVSSLVAEYYVDIVVGKNFDGPPVDAPVEERIKALRGKKIGITGPGSGTEALVTHLFGTVDMNPKRDATLVNLGSAATSAIGALDTGRVDALSFFQPIGQQVEAADKGSIYISPPEGDVPTLRGALHGVVFSTKELLDKKKDEVEGFQRAMSRALGDIHGNPDEVRKLLKKYLKGTDEKALDALVPVLDAEVPPSPEIDPRSFATARAFHLDSGLVKHAPEYVDLRY